MLGCQDLDPPIDVDAGDDSIEVSETASALTGPLTATDWYDYFVQDTCRDANGVAISGDPYACAVHSNLLPNERVRSSFKYSDASRSFALHALPKRSPRGNVSLVVFDSGNNASGKGMFDLDDPHCKVPGSLCYHSGDVDIVDIYESRWNTSWANVVSIIGTAHIGTGGYIGFGTTGLSGEGAWPDGWLLGTHTSPEPTTQIGLNVYRDENRNTGTYLTASVWDKAICTVPLGTVPGVCSGMGYNQWLRADRVYMGDGKTFSDVVISMHTVDFDSLNACAGHLEMFLFSREYGLMSHQTWRRIGCDPSPSANIGCSDSEPSMVISPFTYYFGSTPITLERKACARMISNGAEYSFDPRALPAPSEPTPYPNARVVDEAGYGNVLLNPQLSWPDTAAGGWSVDNATASEVIAGPAQVARFNDAVRVSCVGDCVDSSIYQDLDLDYRAPSLKGATVSFGARVARTGATNGSGRIYLLQFRADGSLIKTKYVAFTASRAWPDPVGTIAATQDTIASDARFLRYQVNLFTPVVPYVLDDLFLLRN